MRAELKSLHSPDIENLSSWIPERQDFAILLQVIAGPAGEIGGESFDLTLCSPSWINKTVEKGRIITGRHLLIVARYDYGRISEFISNYVSSCYGETWQEIALKLARFGHWEFEDYRA